MGGVYAIDRHGLPINYREEFDDGMRLTTATRRSFTGVTQHEDRTMTYKGTTSTFNSDYILADSSDLVTAIEMTVNGSTPVTISSLTYDDLGHITNDAHGGSAGSTSYGYNLRGWTTEIDGKGFHEWLNYTDGSGTPYYSGNISSQHWKASNESFQRNYKFTYDGFGRMLRGDYHDNQSGKNNNYSEILGEYKANGNFRRLQRYGQKGAGGNFGKIDNLHLYFDYNRLKAVREDADPIYGNSAFHFNGSYLTTSEDQQYGYYDDGSLKWDSNKGISHIAYTPQGYPLRVQFRKGHTTEYVYTCDGRRMRTVHRTAMPNITVAFGDTLHLDATNTLSCDTTEYFGDFVFEDGQLSKYLFDGGYCTFTSATGQPTYHYFTCDHQGNVRAVVRQDGTIEQINHYYPLGGIFVGVGTNDSFQKYKYNGKELDRMHGLNFYDYGARQYDPILGRFTQIDPLCEKYYNFHPYAYCKNNPVNAVDPDGMDIWDISVTGNIVNHIQTNEYDMIRISNNHQGFEPSFKFKYGTISHQTQQTKDGANYELFNINGDENGKNIFEFVAQNTDVEWTKAQTGKPDGTNIITTSHNTETELGFVDYISKNYTDGMIIRDITHNHPSGSAFPSFGNKRNSGDIPFAKYISYLTKQNPTFHIYTLQDGRYGYTPYGPNSKISDFILNGASLNNVIIYGKKK